MPVQVVNLVLRPWLEVSTSGMTGDQADPVFGARPSPLRQSGEALQRCKKCSRSGFVAGPGGDGPLS